MGCIRPIAGSYRVMGARIGTAARNGAGVDGSDDDATNGDEVQWPWSLIATSCEVQYVPQAAVGRSLQRAATDSCV